MAGIATPDNDFRSALNSLKTSSAAIEKHTKVLEAQREALLAFKPRDEATKNRNSIFQQHEQESSRLLFALDDLLHSTNEQLEDAEQESSQAISRLKAVASERLAADDQVLEALSTLASQVLRTKTDAVAMSTAENWCRTLASLREQEARARVEAIYHDQLINDTQNGVNSSPTKQDLEELQEELQTLREEIPSIVQMVIGHEIRDPLLRNMQTCESHLRQSRTEWSEYVTSTLEHLIAQLETMSDSAIDLGSYSSAIHEFRPMITATEAEANPQNEPSKSAVSSPTESNSRSKFMESRSGVTASAIPQVLRRLDQEIAVTGDRTKILKALDLATSEAMAKLRTQYSAAQNATLENLDKSLGPRERDLSAITRMIYANSENDNIRLSDRELDAELQALNEKVDDVAAALEKASLSQKDQPTARSSALKSKWL